MKRKIIIILTLLLISLILLSACNTNNLAEYKIASEKTEQITKGQTAGEFTMTTEINQEGLTAYQIKELNYVKDMKGSFSVMFDDPAGKTIIRNYINFGGLGYDFEVYINEEEMSIKLPVIGKYLRVDEEMISENEEYYHAGANIISEGTMTEFTMKWLSLMKEEDVFKGKNIVLTTPDGEVKTTEYTIKLNDEQIRSLLKDSAGILSKDKNLKAFYEKNLHINTGTEEKIANKAFEEVLNDILRGAEEFNVENFSYNALVDIDGYIVNEIIDISLIAKDTQREGLIGVHYNLDIKTWDINKDQNFEFPTLTDENTIKTDEMKENMPAGMEDYFSKVK